MQQCINAFKLEYRDTRPSIKSPSTVSACSVRACSRLCLAQPLQDYLAGVEKEQYVLGIVCTWAMGGEEWATAVISHETALAACVTRQASCAICIESHVIAASAACCITVSWACTTMHGSLDNAQAAGRQLAQRPQ